MSKQQELFVPTSETPRAVFHNWLWRLTDEQIISLFLSEDEAGTHALPYEAIIYQLGFHTQIGNFDLPRLEADVLAAMARPRRSQVAK